MSKDNLKVRVSKTIAIEKIRKFYVQATKKQVTLDEVTKLIEERKIPKEVFDDSIAEFIEEKRLIPLDSQQGETLVLNVPQYLISKVIETTFDPNIVDSNRKDDLLPQSKSDLPPTQETPDPLLNLFNPILFDQNPESTPKSSPYYSRVLPQYAQSANNAQNLLNYSLSQKIAQNKNSNTNQSFSRNQATLEARYAVMNVPEFSGKDTRKVFEFVEKVDNVYKIVDINQINLLNILILNKLTDDAEQLVRDHKPDNWQELRRILLDHYATRKSVNKRICDLVTCKQGTGTVIQFAGELQGICTGIRYAAREENMNVQFVQDLLIKTFIDGLNRDVGLVVRAQRPNNYQDALRLAIETESEISPTKSIKKYCNFCRKDSHNTRDCRVAHRQNRFLAIGNVEEQSKKPEPNDVNYINKYEQKRQYQNNNWENRNTYFKKRFNYNNNYSKQPFRSKSPIQNYYGRNSNSYQQGYKNYPVNNNQNYKERRGQNYNDKSTNYSYQDGKDKKKPNERFDNNNKKDSTNRINLNHTSTQTHAVVMGRMH